MLAWGRAYSGLLLPFTIWLLTTYFQTVPREIEEAALIDGCSPLQALVQVTIPLARPGVFATIAFEFISTWTDLLMALVLTNTPAHQPLSVLVSLFAAGMATDTPWGADKRRGPAGDDSPGCARVDLQKIRHAARVCRGGDQVKEDHPHPEREGAFPVRTRRDREDESTPRGRGRDRARAERRTSRGSQRSAIVEAALPSYAGAGSHRSVISTTASSAASSARVFAKVRTRASRIRAFEVLPSVTHTT